MSELTEKQKKKNEKKRLKNEKTLRKMKKNRWWGGFIGFILFSSVIAITLVVLIAWMLTYVVESKLVKESSNARLIAQLYSDKMSGKDEMDRMLDALELQRDYIVLDKNGNQLEVKGTDTRNGSNTLNYTTSQLGSVVIYQDIQGQFLKIDNDNSVDIDFKGLFDKKPLAAGGKRYIEEEDRLIVPFWMGVEVPDSDNMIFVKSSVDMDEGDVIFMAIVIGGVALILLGGYVIMIINLVRGIANHRRVNTMLFTDPVTKNTNWTWFKAKGEQLISSRKGASYNFAVTDFDFVKYRNFCIAHSVEEGERALKDVFDVISANLSDKEICAHSANAHFAVLLSYVNEENLDSKIRSILSKLEKLYVEHKLAFHVGVAKKGVKLDDRGRAIRRSDADIEQDYFNACAAAEELTESDDSGISYFDELLVEQQKWIDTVNDNQEAAVKNEEFQVYYQPKYDPKTNKLAGAEALIRWISPEYGFVSPGKFIPIFEKNGFITEIDHYMITHVARDQKRWLDQGYKCVPVSVNVSRAHFVEDDLAEQIRDMVDREGAPHDLVEIELTESAFFDDKNAMITTINKLKEYGFSVSMDDFGAGYSSLNSLKDMPLDVLKLDAEFFRGENEGGRAQIVVSEAIRLAKQLNMRTVAEGVEDREQVEFLAEHDCDMIQGYYYAKPMPPAEYEERMRAGFKDVEAEKAAIAEKKAENKTEGAAAQTATN
ncbi:MAG: GGDEF domain-containing protein [Eubacterium sp.]|nr:GGDEF domain-containing protein [Eubacterium sp.]